MSRRLEEEFEVDTERADRGVLALVDKLFQQKLVQVWN